MLLIKKSDRSFKNLHGMAFGFSLIEIMVALALFAGVVLGVMSLFPALHQQAQESEQSTHATFIAQRIFEMLQATAPQGVLATGPAWKSDANAVIYFSLKNPSTHFIAYDSKDQPVRLLAVKQHFFCKIEKRGMKKLEVMG